jgi:hypothetical protein
MGHYSYRKRHRSGLPLTCRVEVFQLDVVDLARDWPEKKKRKRRWMRPHEAAAAVDEPELAELLRRL